MFFKDRFDAGKQLADHLKRYESLNPMALLVPRGGVEVGLEAISRYHLDWDLIIPRKIGAPHNQEVAIGAVTMDGNYLLYEEYIKQINVPPAYIQNQIQKEVAEIKRRLLHYRKSDEFPNIQNRTIILIDDGIATGFTLLAAIKSIHAHQPHKLILAVPVAPTETIEAFRQFVDEIVCLYSVDQFTSVGAYYESFPQVSENQMLNYLDLLNKQHTII